MTAQSKAAHGDGLVAVLRDIAETAMVAPLVGDLAALPTTEHPTEPLHNWGSWGEIPTTPEEDRAFGEIEGGAL